LPSAPSEVVRARAGSVLLNGSGDGLETSCAGIPQVPGSLVARIGLYRSPSAPLTVSGCVGREYSRGAERRQWVVLAVTVTVIGSGYQRDSAARASAARALHDHPAAHTIVASGIQRCPLALKRVAFHEEDTLTVCAPSHRIRGSPDGERHRTSS